MHIDEFVLNEYLDETLSDNERDVVAQHLAVCPDCQARLAELQRVFTALANVAEVELTTDLAPRVLADMPLQEQPRRWLRLMVGMQAVTAVIFLTILWPSIQTVLMTIREWGQEQVTAVSWPPEWWQRLGVWGTAMMEQFSNEQSTINLPAEQWLWLIGLALITWLVGNTVLLNPRRRQSLGTGIK
jgi:anti-sigma factor RsiW